jgi:hypothetical protein
MRHRAVQIQHDLRVVRRIYLKWFRTVALDEIGERGGCHDIFAKSPWPAFRKPYDC